MKNNNSLTIDWTQKEAGSILFPGSSLLSSHKAGWENITLEHHLVNSVWERPKINYAQHTVILHLNAKTNLERKIGDRRQDYNMSIGDIAIVPAHISHYAVNKNECEGLFLALDPQFVAQIAYETDTIILIFTPQLKDRDLINLDELVISKIKCS